jgi:hypothetical protein
MHEGNSHSVRYENASVNHRLLRYIHVKEADINIDCRCIRSGRVQWTEGDYGDT